MKICGSFFITVFLFLAAGAQTTAPPKISGNTSAQTPPAESCRLKLADAPVLRGLRLDMAKTDVQKAYPLMTITSDPVKSSGIALSHQISNPEYQENLDRVTVVFRNDKIFSILLTYNDSISWDSAEEFAQKISASLNLPKPVARRREGGTYYSVNCGAFAIRTRITGEKQPVLLLTRDPDELWETTQQKKDAFKP
jgi:hypothetical protein